MTQEQEETIEITPSAVVRNLLNELEKLDCLISNIYEGKIKEKAKMNAEVTILMLNLFRQNKLSDDDIFIIIAMFFQKMLKDINLQSIEEKGK
jgi:hypothetical protein